MIIRRPFYRSAEIVVGVVAAAVLNSLHRNSRAPQLHQNILDQEAPPSADRRSPSVAGAHIARHSRRTASSKGHNGHTECEDDRLAHLARRMVRGTRLHKYCFFACVYMGEVQIQDSLMGKFLPGEH